MRIFFAVPIFSGENRLGALELDQSSFELPQSADLEIRVDDVANQEAADDISRAKLSRQVANVICVGVGVLGREKRRILVKGLHAGRNARRSDGWCRDLQVAKRRGSRSGIFGECGGRTGRS